MKPHNPTEMKLIGIAAIACYVPAIYLDIEELAINRAIETDLNKMCVQMENKNFHELFVN